MEVVLPIGQHAAMKNSLLPSTALASCLLLAASCGGNDDDDGVALVDGGNGGVDASNVDAAPRVCSIAADLGSPAGLTFTGILRDQDPAAPGVKFIDLVAISDQGPPVDAINVQLWPGFGPFDPALAVGSFPIAGDEANFYLCGACALLIGDFDPMTNMTAQDYVASSGTINITTAGTAVGETIEGSIDNMVYREVTFDDDNQVQTDVANGCTVNITTVPFTATLELPAPPVAGAPLRGRRRN